VATFFDLRVATIAIAGFVVVFAGAAVTFILRSRGDRAA